MPEFLVRHTIVVVAADPAAAAEAYRATQARDAAFTTVFEVSERLPDQRLGPPSRSTWNRVTWTSSPRSCGASK